MKLFKSMNERESLHWKKGAFFGFYTYLLISAVNYFYYLATENVLFSPTFVFWSGLLGAFVFELIFNLKYKYRSDN
ncbi:hypothetical protein [Virgibacillus alimentarius]|uniref:2TM domain-containing protein n=1 Tax=Virgibacillus alimentarius TaxID=698769 RepID=A0ABS4S896_9BACI|nr:MULTISPECIES: hypothetical protein [Virgibacillus]MBP2257634.1 hypothetical protein [Virgibacillus alimentarius]HLR68469.1 hypothetical protein [Virgibacillus sp.]